MARFNEILVGRYNRALQKLLSMKGAASLVTLSDELFAVYPFETGVENRYLEAWNRFGFGGFIGAPGAGNTAGFRLRNPLGSNVLAVIELLAPYQTVAGNTIVVAVQAITTDLASILSLVSSAFDSRGSSSPSLIGSITSGASTDPIPATGSVAQMALGASAPYTLIATVNQEIPVLPGHAIDVIAATTNSAFGISAFWRERFLEESERF